MYSETSRLIVHPKYEHLRAELHRIEELFDREGHEIHRGRNVLRTLQIGGIVLCVKRYGKMPLRHRIATRFFKNSKAKNAFFKPFLLKERGFDSPEPVAFASVRHGLFSATNYFVCLYSTFRYTMADALALPEAERSELLMSFAHFAARLHRKGSLHKDFSSRNILFDRVEGKFRFSLIDTNSVKFGQRGVSVERGCANFARLDGDEAFFGELARYYAALRKADEQSCLQWMLEARRARLNRVEARQTDYERILKRAQS